MHWMRWIRLADRTTILWTLIGSQLLLPRVFSIVISKPPSLVVGANKVGKSSLVNSLVDANVLLPTLAVQGTKKITALR